MGVTRAEYARAYRKTPKYQAWRKAHQAANRPRYNAQQRAYRAAHPEETRAQVRKEKSKRGEIMRKQNTENARKLRGLPLATRPEPEFCEICGRDSGDRCGLHLDHDHKTGRFRGWICYRCNLAIGMLGDNSYGTARATAYLLDAERAP